MTKIDVIIPSENKGWMYPLILWKDKFLERDIHINIKNNTNDFLKSKPDLVILTSRYYTNEFNTTAEYVSNIEKILKNDVTKYRSVNSKLIYYDLSAATGSRELHLIKYVDLFLKRQIFKNKSIYKDGVDGTQQYRIWATSEKLDLYSCTEDELKKIKVGWNLGYRDYSSPLFVLFNRSFTPFWSRTNFTSPDTSKPITCSFRGKLNTGHGGQRKKGIEILKKLDDSRFVTGPTINKKDFYKEMAASKVVFSPFGHGEICYRDIESFVYGAILIKPDVSHIETFPNLFIEHKTYIPCSWDLSDLEKLLIEIDQNYKDYKHIAHQGQKTFKEISSDFDLFYDHFTDIINSV